MPNENKKIKVKTKVKYGDSIFFDEAVSDFEEVHTELKGARKSEPHELNPEEFDYAGAREREREEAEEEAAEAEAALYDEFDRTYEGKKGTPLYKKWWFWLILAAAVVGLVLAFLNFGRIDNGEEAETASVVAQGTNGASTEPNYQTITIKDLVTPAGSEVKKGPNGKWGLYDSNELISSYNGIASNEYGTWYINYGYVDFVYTGYLLVNGTTYKVNKGKVDISAPVATNNTANAVTGADVQTSQAGQPQTDAGLNSGGSQSQQDALAIAVDYINQMAFSRDWLVAQVESEGYSHDDAVWAADHCGADWNDQAYKKAQEYLKLTTFTKDDMITQLEFEGFTADQAQYGAERVGL